MTTFSIKWEPATELVSSAATNGLLGESSYIRNANFTASDTAWWEGDVTADNECPRIGSELSENPVFRCTDRTVTRITPIYGTLKATYTAKVREIGEGFDNPLDLPAIKSWQTIATEEAVDEDRHGNPIVTYNGEPISGIKKTIYDLQLTVKKNFSFFDEQTFYAFIGTVNETDFRGYPAGTAKLVDISGNEIFGDELLYVEATAVWQFRRAYRTTPDRAWWRRVRHEGFYVMDDPADRDAGVKPRLAVDKNKEPVTSPVMINAENGTQELDLTVGWWVEWDVDDVANHNSLNFF